MNELCVFHFRKRKKFKRNQSAKGQALALQLFAECENRNAQTKANW